MKFVQYNELVLNHTVYIDKTPEVVTEFKESHQEYSNGHGDYAPRRCGVRFVKSKEWDIELKLDKKKFPCDEQQVVEQFVKDNLQRDGRLWATIGDVLVWGNARVISYGEMYEEKLGYISLNCKFYLPEGVWHIADPQATYLEDYYSCNIMDCYEALERPLCECCWCNVALIPERKCFPCKGERLCEIPHGDLDKMIGSCGNTKKINYSCDKQTATATVKSAYNDTTAHIEFDGQTMYETDDVVVEICGKFEDLVIDWNGERSTIEGKYDGKTIISGSIVTNGCDTLPFDKFHGVCKTTGNGNDACGSNPMELGVKSGAKTLVKLSVKKGTNHVFFYGLDPEDIQTINIYVGGIAI